MQAKNVVRRLALALRAWALVVARLLVLPGVPIILSIGIWWSFHFPFKPMCPSLAERELRVGITEWAGFGGGILANGGPHATAGSSSSLNGDLHVEFIILDGFKERKEALCGCAAVEKHVDILWSSIESWAGEYPLLKKEGIHARAIMQFARSHVACAVLGDRDTDLRHLSLHGLVVPRFTPAHWLAKQTVSDEELIDTVDSSESALRQFQKHTSKAVALCEPFLQRAKGPGTAELSTYRDVNYILIARQASLDDKEAVPKLKDFIRNWLTVNEAAELDRMRDLIIENKHLDDPKLQDVERDRIEAEQRHLQLASFGDNTTLFGIGGGKPTFDAEFEAARKVWTKKEAEPPGTNRFSAQDARFDYLLSEIYTAKKSKGPCDAIPEDIHAIPLRFESGSAAVLGRYYSSLDNIADELKKHPEAYACIDGYTDNVGDPKANQDLSDRRAASVAEYLNERGVGRDRLSVIGQGDTHPLEANASGEGRTVNRRAEIKLLRLPPE